MRYVLDFGGENAGGSPTFSVFKNADTLADVTPPSLVEVTSGDGLFYFDWTWSSTSATSIAYKAQIGATEVSDVIASADANTSSSSAGTAAGLNPWLWTAAQIINMAAVECGLAEVEDPYTSTDPNFILLRTLLKSTGHELMQARDWMVLLRECTIAGDGSTSTFTLPADFLRMADQSGYNRTTRFPMGGPVSPQQWQDLKARTAVVSVTTLYRLQQGRIVFYVAPPSANDIRFEYVSRYWAASVGATSADLYAPAAAGDTVLFEPLMTTRRLIWKFKQAKGEDTVAAKGDYDTAFETAAGLEPAPVLRADGGSRSGGRFLDGYNVADTGFGS